MDTRQLKQYTYQIGEGFFNSIILSPEGYAPGGNTYIGAKANKIMFHFFREKIETQAGKMAYLEGLGFKPSKIEPFDLTHQTKLKK
jgi:hypothetical protein